MALSELEEAYTATQELDEGLLASLSSLDCASLVKRSMLMPTLSSEGKIIHCR